MAGAITYRQKNKSQVSVGKSSKLGSSEIPKVPSTKRHQRLENNDSFSSYQDPKTLDLINYCTKHGQIYLYITHVY